jgi:shikimate kinase
MHLVLLGYRASGKTTTGRALAHSLGLPFVDLDQRLASKLAMTIADAFTRYGEPWFRAAECVELEQALNEAWSVIALGGGTPCSPAAGELLRRARTAGRARTFYLRARPATLRARLSAADNAHRPTLTGAAHPADEVDEVLARRAPLYAACADHTLDVDDLSPEAAAANLITLIGRPKS